ncbi:hypothetical protein [Hyphococcus luteus]|uniref:DUF4145 domain-containing protein n=1 Tax=Hyphococcus luteus TaxID=2058213 RepID=A0A2S7K6N7_9PROT|nr:hypothetical protein [Marinicaulis flavus]PQA88131.1 hypothetical protein CW354_07375 [Marinicaulis flavus]
MNFLEFVAAIIETLVWPITLVGLIVWGRPYLARIPEFIKSAKYKDWEVTFRDRLEVLESDAESAGLDIPDDLPKEYQDLLRNNSDRLHIVVIEAWAMVERALRTKLKPAGTTHRPRYSFSSLAQSLFREGILSEEEYGLVREFQLARNRAVHEEVPNLNETVVIMFLRISAALIDRINEISTVKQ